jgi:hypothetical protein
MKRKERKEMTDLPLPDGSKETLKRAFWFGYVYAVFTGARLVPSADSEPPIRPH